MVYSLARETFMLHVAWCDRRERRKTEREGGRKREGEGGK